ncbi:MAG: peptide ABC transporter permease, partial [Lysobacteraceae bacterium]
MPRYQLLDNVAHKDLRVIARFGPEFGDAAGMVPAFPTEWAELQREYPIFFRRDPAGAWQSVALLGFDAGENLFLRDDRWDAAYLPGAVARGPFLIGFQERLQDGELRREPVVHVDLEHPRASFDEGEPVFLQHGGHSPYLEHVIGVLRGMHDGTDMGKAMFAAFEAAGLLQPLALRVQVDEHTEVNVTGLHGIDRDRME